MCEDEQEKLVEERKHHEVAINEYRSVSLVGGLIVMRLSCDLCVITMSGSTTNG